jgi:hypothetical protein
VRLLAGVPLCGRFLEVTQAANVGDVVKPPSRPFVEMLQGVKGAAVE